MTTVFFDLGATLITGPDRGPAGRIAEQLSLSKEQKKQLSSRIMTSKWQEPEHLCDYITSEFYTDKGATETVAKEIWYAQFEEVKKIEGSLDVLSRMKEAEFNVGVISNIWHPYLQGAISALGSHYDDMTGPRFFSYDREMAKPDDRVFETVVDEAKVSADRCVMIGDTYEMDIQPALENGMAAIWILHRPKKEKQDLVRVLNGEAPCPNITLDHISQLEADHIHEALAQIEEAGDFDYAD